MLAGGQVRPHRVALLRGVPVQAPFRAGKMTCRAAAATMDQEESLGAPACHHQSFNSGRWRTPRPAHGPGGTIDEARGVKCCGICLCRFQNDEEGDQGGCAGHRAHAALLHHRL